MVSYPSGHIFLVHAADRAIAREDGNHPNQWNRWDMFFLKKLISAFILPPGLFVTFLLFSGVFFFIRGSRKCGGINFLCAVCLWGISISPVANLLMYSLESDFQIPDSPKGDVILLLGGGVIGDVPDMTGNGTPSSRMMWRIATAVRLHKKMNLPIIISGGSLYPGQTPEAPIVKRFLVDLGVPEKQVIVEDKARDTIENAEFTIELMRKSKFFHPVLVTDASHMRRSILAFSKQGVNVTPFPAVFKAKMGRHYGIHDYLPGAGAFKESSSALHEYLGYFYYWIVF